MVYTVEVPSVCCEMRVTVPTTNTLFSLHHGTVLASMPFHLSVLIDEACRAESKAAVSRVAKREVGQ
jgi:hypothetical protein